MTIANGTVATISPPAALAIRPGQEMWTDKQRAALGVLGIKDATNGDLAVFMHYCQKTGLDPFSRQIYMIMRREKQGDQWVAKQTIQVGIDGFRVIRDRIAQRLGVTVEYEDTIWYDGDGGAHHVWLWEDAPAACMVTVIKDGRRFPGVVRTASYMQRNKQGDPVSQWKTQPDHMIEKCAEAFALRRAFPNDLGGMYLDDEMPPPERQQAAPQRVTAADIVRQPPADTPDVPSAGSATPPAHPAAAQPAAEGTPLPPLPGEEDVSGPETGNVPATQQRPAGGEAGAGPETQPDEKDYDTPGTVTRQQVGKLQTVYHARLGYTKDERDLILEATEEIIRRGLLGPAEGRTHNNLSFNEAKALIDTLERCGTRDRLVLLLRTGEMPAASDG